jgi:hypothetical protein
MSYKRKLRKRKLKIQGKIDEKNALVLDSIRKMGFNPLTLQNETEEEYFARCPEMDPNYDPEAVIEAPPAPPKVEEIVEVQIEEEAPEEAPMDVEEILEMEPVEEEPEEEDPIMEPVEEEPESAEEIKIVDVDDPSTWPEKGSEEWKPVPPSIKRKITKKRKKLSEEE